MKSLSPLKKKALLASGTLNLHPEAVRSELFRRDFFDRHDRAQVKYEMLRAHSVDEQTVTEACRQFGFSRESFYQIRQAFTAEGFSSLIPKKRGRKGPTKLKGALWEFVQQKKTEKPELDPAQLSSMIAQRYGVQIHRTTVMRAMKKKPLSAAGDHAGRIRRKR
jgi:transposase